MGRHLQRHRIALIAPAACVLALLLVAVVVPRALPPGDDDGAVPLDEGAASTRAGAADPSLAADAGIPPDGPSAADASAADADAPPVTRRVSSLGMCEEAQSVLSSYRERGGCVLARAGYVDLMGRVWSCTVQGDGWVDVVVVRSGEEGGGSVVTTARMRRDEWSPGSLLSDLGGSDGS